MLKKLEQADRPYKELDDGLRKQYSNCIRRALGADVNSTADEYGILKNGKENKYEIHKNVNTKLFYSAFETIKPYFKQNELVDLHDNYDDCKCFLSKDGLQSFAIEKNGNLISVFNANPDKCRYIEAVKDLIKESGATHLDCYGYLSDYYSKTLGFKTVSVMDYKIEYDHHNIGSRFNMPQIAFMADTSSYVELKHFKMRSI